MTRTQPVTSGFINHNGNCAVCSDSKPNDQSVIEHSKRGHTCMDASCKEGLSPHGHRTLIESIKQLFPFEDKVKNLKISNNTEINQTLKQLLLMITNLTPALAASEVMKPFEVTPFVASPIAISAMHFTNRGVNQLQKWLFTSLSSVGIVALQKFANLPRTLIRPLMALAVFFIERNGNNGKNITSHVHDKNCDHEHRIKSVKVTKSYPVSNTKADLIKLVKLQGQINTVPWVINTLTDKLSERVSSYDNFLTRILGRVGTFVFQVIGLSAGFVALGKLLDKLFTRFNIVSDEDALAMRTEGAVCACCGAPVCVAEVASEVGSMSVAA